MAGLSARRGFRGGWTPRPFSSARAPEPSSPVACRVSSGCDSGRRNLRDPSSPASALAQCGPDRNRDVGRKVAPLTHPQIRITWVGPFEGPRLECGGERFVCSRRHSPRRGEAKGRRLRAVRARGGDGRRARGGSGRRAWRRATARNRFHRRVALENLRAEK